MHTLRPLKPTRPQWQQWLMNLSIVVGCLLSAALASSTWQARTHPEIPANTSPTDGVLFALASLVCTGFLCFRHKKNLLPVTAAVACLPPLFLPTDALPALIGMASVLVWTQGAAPRIVVTSLCAVATTCSVWRDTRGTRPKTTFWNGLFHGSSEKSWAAMPLWQVLVLSLICLSVTAGIATLRRSRMRVMSAEDRAQAASQTAQNLQSDLIRHDEREALAREVHDVLGHRLSILSMQASALEIETSDAAPGIRTRAHQIQSGASESMADLRSLLTLLREGPTAPERPADLTDISLLVRECIEAGTPVSSNIFIDRSLPLDEVVSRSAHRIATEMLTNARKHTPGAPVTLNIVGNPQEGLTITATNQLSGHSDAELNTSFGAPSGLTGMGTRAHDLGGTFTAGPTPDGRYFTASAHLPWRLPHH